MLIGFGNKKKDQPQTAPNGAADQSYIFDATTENFEQTVMQRSMNIPILVDFWAPWCGPCRQLMPVLEELVQGANGKILLAKVNIDESPELAQALRVQSVPTVFAFFQGQPVTGFNGVRPKAELNMLIEQLIKMAAQMQDGAIDIDAAMKDAHVKQDAGDYDGAHALYEAVLHQDPDHAPAYAGIARILLAQGYNADAQDWVDNAPEKIAKSTEIAAVRTAIDLAAHRQDDKTLSGLRALLSQNENNHEARFDLAQALFAGGQAAAAIDELLIILKKDRTWQDEKARLKLLEFFEALGPTHPDTIQGRRKLSAWLFS